MSHKLLFESWRKYLTEQALNFPDEDEEEFDIYKLLNIDSITGEEFVDDVGKVNAHRDTAACRARNFIGVRG